MKTPEFTISIGQRVECYLRTTSTGTIVDILHANIEYCPDKIYKYYRTVRPGLLCMRIPRLIFLKDGTTDGFIVMPFVPESRRYFKLL